MFFWGGRALKEVVIVANVLIGVRLVLKLNQSGFFILITLTLLMKIVRCFVWRKFSSIGREGWYEKMKDAQKLKLGDSHVTPRHIQEVQASKLGDAQGIPFFINKNIRSSLKTLYFYSFARYVLFLERQLFLLLVCFVFFAVVYGWILAYLFWRETRSIFIA